VRISGPSGGKMVRIPRGKEREKSHTCRFLRQIIPEDRGGAEAGPYPVSSAHARVRSLRRKEDVLYRKAKRSIAQNSFFIAKQTVLPHRRPLSSRSKTFCRREDLFRPEAKRFAAKKILFVAKQNVPSQRRCSSSQSKTFRRKEDVLRRKEDVLCRSPTV